MSLGFNKIARLLLGKKKHKNTSKTRRIGRPTLRIEPLEARVVLATDCLGAIQGIVSVDNNANGTFEAGEQVAGAQVIIYRDNGDGVFNAGSDAVEVTLTTDANGMYEVNNLTDGNYFAVQSAGTFGGNTLTQMVSPLKTIDGDGVDGQLIDDFTTISPPVVDSPPPDGTPVEGVTTASEAVGGQRDLTANMLTFNGQGVRNVEVEGNGAVLLFNPDSQTTGEYSIVWDGVDAVGGGINTTGLATDLTDIGGTTGLGQGIRLSNVRFDEINTTVTIRIYSGAGISEAVINSITPDVTQDFFVPFTGTFVATAGGGADFTNVGAIEVLVRDALENNDGEIDSIEVVGINPVQCDFINEAPVPSIDIEKFTNGNQADLATDADVPVININNTSTVTWTYIVTNDGQLPLNNVQLVDDQIGSIGTANITNRSINNDNILDVGETWTFTVTGATEAGPYTNKGTITGMTAGGVTVMDMDTSNYLGIGPSIDIEKTTNGFQADLATDADVPQISTGSQVTWVYTVTNDGTDPLTNVLVNDNQIGAITTITSRSINNDTILDVGEVWTFTAVGVAIAGNYENAGTVTGIASDQTTVTDTDLSHYVGLQPNIDIEKSTNNIDADIVGTGPQVFVGSTVTFRYTVTNTGGVPLSNVVVTDDNGTSDTTGDDFSPTFTGGDTDGDGILDLIETWTYEATRTATLGPYTNIGRVTGSDGAGTNVNDADASNHSAIAAPEVASKRRFLASSF